jgi:anti-repressor protein
MNQIQIFNNQEFGEIRGVEIDGKPHAVGVDVARALEYANPSKAVLDHCKGISKIGIPSAGGNQETNIIPEGDIYRLIVKAADQSRNLEIRLKAERFEKWIFDEVVPSIRQNGTYSVTIKDSYTIEDPIERAQRWIEEQKERKLLSDKLEEQKPKVIFADAVSVSDKDILIRQMAKILHQNGIEIGERRLFQWLRDKSYLEKYRNFPTQKAMELGLFKVQETAVTHSSGSVTTSFTPKVTPKGCLYFINKFLEVREKVI